MPVLQFLGTIGALMSSSKQRLTKLPQNMIMHLLISRLTFIEERV